MKILICHLLAVASLSISHEAASAEAPEAPLSVQLRGTSEEVLQFIEDHFGKGQTNGFRLTSNGDRASTYKADCMAVPYMNAFNCRALMMTVADPRWDGPTAVLTFSTAEVDGIVSLTGLWEWCATSFDGKSKCIPNRGHEKMNGLLRKFDQAFKQDVRPL